MTKNKQSVSCCVLFPAGVQCNTEPGLHSDRGLLCGYVAATRVKHRHSGMKCAVMLIVFRPEDAAVPQVSGAGGLGRSVCSNSEAPEGQASAQTGGAAGEGTTSSTEFTLTLQWAWPSESCDPLTDQWK